jgi:hypothetical protein
MSFDFGSAAGGAAQGAAAGASFGPIGAGTGAILGGVTSGLLGRKKPKAPDYTPLINMLNQSYTNKLNTISALRPKTTALNNQYKTDLGNLTSGFVSNIANQGRQYVNDAADASGQLTNASAEAGKKQILSAQPELTQNTREALASSGLNRGGALVSAIEKQNQNAGEQIGNLNTSLQLQNLQNKTQAIKDAFQTNAGAVTSATGLDAAGLQKLLDSGREDLINEAHDLIQAEQDKTSGIAGVMGQQIQSSYAANLAKQNQNQALINSILGGVASTAGQLGTQNQLKQMLLPNGTAPAVDPRMAELLRQGRMTTNPTALY